MKKVQINQAKTEIDWSKPMWVQAINNPSVIILTTGKHSRNDFTGIVMPCTPYPNGYYTKNWTKEYYAPLVGEIQFTISNED